MLALPLRSRLGVSIEAPGSQIAEGLQPWRVFEHVYQFSAVDRYFSFLVRVRLTQRQRQRPNVK